MKKINLKQPITTLTGKPMKNSEGVEWTFGTYLSELVLALKTEGSMKRFILARDLLEKEEITVKADDFAIIKGAVKAGAYFQNEGLNGLFNGQIEIYLEELKDITKEDNSSPTE